MVKTQTTEKRFTVAVDAMGGDHAPQEVVAGAVQAVREGQVAVLLVGDPAAIRECLAQHAVEGLPLDVAPAEGVIQETDPPVQAMRDKPRASVVEAARLVKQGRAQAMMSMGSTGAAMASATLVLGLLEGIERPAIGGPLLHPLSQAVILDLGSNVDCRPSQLIGFAAIGCAFARSFQGVAQPRVALLSVGTEEGKGNRQVREAFPLFQRSGLRFVGNIEGMDFFSDKADVVVCDGFVGNILMKFAEGLGTAIARHVGQLLAQRLGTQAVQKLGEEVSALTNIVELGGGGPLFGVDGIAIVGHGRARAASVAAAIAMAKKAADLHLVETMRQELAKVRQGLKV